MRAANASSLSNPNPTSKRRRLIMLSFLIEHPTEGLILYETGGGDDYPEIVGPPVQDVFSRVDYDKSMNLDAAIAKTGHHIDDIKMVIIGHLHLDHSGGLEHFKGKNVPVYVHELELKYAFYSVATKTDVGVYLPHYLTFDINWRVLRDRARIELASLSGSHAGFEHFAGQFEEQRNVDLHE
jgi:glyoxylase-like metal-dependent hydrolase (beta-lactamase superfamily II)